MIHKKLTPFFMCIFLVLATAVNGKAEKPIEIKVRFGPLSNSVHAICYEKQIGNDIKNGLFIAYGVKISASSIKDGKLTLSTLNRKKRLQLPGVFEFNAKKGKRAVYVYEKAPSGLKWVPHWGFEIKIDKTVIGFLDADADGVMLEEKEDMVVGPDSATGMTFLGDFWTEEQGYDAELEKSKNGDVLKLYKLPFPKGGKNKDINKAWAIMNCWRQRAGCHSVEWNETLANQCQKHAEYCDTTGYNGHSEDPNNPAYTEEGYKGGINSCCGYANSTYSESIIEQFRTVYHLSAILQPGLQASGMGLCGKAFAVDVRSKVNRHYRMKSPIEYAWPPHGSRNVFCGFNPAGENPMPIFGHQTAYRIQIGQCAFARIHASAGYEMSLRTRKGKEIECHITHPDRSASLYGGNRGLICAAPKEHLNPQTDYIANVSFTDKSQMKVTFSWVFRTEP